ncbi:MAG: molybdopterin-binding protein [Acidobacteria bacterium]|nr:molybdopterin-binding protein [Acidobacteriota bacterium]
MKISARNVLSGTVVKVTHGAVNTEVVLDIGNGVHVVSIISRESAEKLGLAEGTKAWAVIKASSVMLATD